MTRRLLLLCLTAAAFTMQPVQQVAAQPTALRDDIQVRNMLSLDKGIFRIVKDRRDNTLYTLAGNGSISRIERPENAVGETIAQGRVNPNTGEPLGMGRRKVIADNTVFHDKTRASRVLLPIHDV